MEYWSVTEALLGAPRQIYKYLAEAPKMHYVKPIIINQPTYYFLIKQFIKIINHRNITYKVKSNIGDLKRLNQKWAQYLG